MITLKIDNPELEKMFHEDFNSDNDSFVKFLSINCYANNVEYDNISKIKVELENKDCYEDSGYTFDEAINLLEKKYAN